MSDRVVMMALAIIFVRLGILGICMKNGEKPTVPWIDLVIGALIWAMVFGWIEAP